jgi:hypothetical protein
MSFLLLWNWAKFNRNPHRDHQVVQWLVAQKLFASADQQLGTSSVWNLLLMGLYFSHWAINRMAYWSSADLFIWWVSPAQAMFFREQVLWKLTICYGGLEALRVLNKRWIKFSVCMQLISWILQQLYAWVNCLNLCCAEKHWSLWFWFTLQGEFHNSGLRALKSFITLGAWRRLEEAAKWNTSTQRANVPEKVTEMWINGTRSREEPGTVDEMGFRQNGTIATSL